ncbi:SUMF1/EgtB/PvdO family nonheme iron enzyme [Micromonospora sp. NPDC047467]|uniref:formylglycine-generating enzyme family protein n=1 Tax=Micromonospora sp. NPDC047467 TaxID=3154814 RepID=UPI0033DA4EDB
MGDWPSLLPALTPSERREVEDDLEDLLELLPFQLPSEAQWEYAAPAGTTTLTFHGDGKSDEDQLLDDFGDEARTAARENAFGLAAMGATNELCADVWIPGFTGAPADARPRTGEGPRTVRGGAADAHPWQGCDEWLLILSATRYEHAQFTAVRPVVPLPHLADGHLNGSGGTPAAFGMKDSRRSSNCCGTTMTVARWAWLAGWTTFIARGFTAAIRRHTETHLY